MGHQSKTSMLQYRQKLLRLLRKLLHKNQNACVRQCQNLRLFHLLQSLKQDQSQKENLARGSLERPVAKARNVENQEKEKQEKEKQDRKGLSLNQSHLNHLIVLK